MKTMLFAAVALAPLAMPAAAQTVDRSRQGDPHRSDEVIVTAPIQTSETDVLQGTSVLRGEDVESRRDFIQRNARDVRFLDI